MTTILIQATKELKGRVKAPSSKSFTHRATIASLLVKGESRIIDPLICEDTIATRNACLSFGAQIRYKKDMWEVCGPTKLQAPQKPINCQDSASTIRFLTPVAALSRGRTVLTGQRGLKKRPIKPLIQALQKLGVECSSNKGYPPVAVYGNEIKGGRTSLVGNISSQFITGLLFACPLAQEATQINLTTPLESKPYVNLTLKILKKHGIKVDVTRNYKSYTIPGQQKYEASTHHIPGDFSSAAFLMVAAAITHSRIVIDNLPPNLPDSQIINILDRMNADISVTESSVKLDGGELKAIDIDAIDIPDLVPSCSILACFAEGETRIYNAKRLRLKESNRLKALSSELSKMGANIMEIREGLKIKGPSRLRGITVNPHYDHRIGMACAVAGLNAEGSTVIPMAECINKSYPAFFKDLKKLGATIVVE